MSLERLFMEVFYRFGFTPWDGHKEAARLTELIEGTNRLPPGRALDIGCGTGGASLYLAEHGWDVTGLDFVPLALKRAKKKAGNKKNLRFLHGDATKLRTYVEPGFDLVLDGGCMHGMSAGHRDAYVPEVTAVAKPGAYLVLLSFLEGNKAGPRGMNPPEVEQRFANGWKLLSAEPDPAISGAKDILTVYVLRRT